jgi:hypothetical protein
MANGVAAPGFQNCIRPSAGGAVKSNHRARLFVLVALVNIQVSSNGEQAKAYRWHNSARYSRVIVNATQGIENRPREWFAQDQLVTDFAITNADSVGVVEAQKRYWAVRQQLESYGLVVGTYISGMSVRPKAEEQSWPPSMVAIERMPSTARYSGNWPGAPHRMLVDPSDPGTRHNLQNEILKLWKEVPAPVHFVDNVAIHRSCGAGAAWSAYCANIKEIRKMGESLGSVQVFNLAVHVGFMSDTETQQLIDAVGSHGICLEMPWHRKFRQNAELTEKARLRYRQLLDSGMGIIMMPLDGDPQQLANWVWTWRKPSDHLYISGVFTKAPDMRLFGPIQ